MRKAPHHDLYSSPGIYDAMFSWDPAVEASYLDLIVKRFSKVRSVRDGIDIGCGTGRVASALEQLGYRVLCLDLSKEMCSYSRRVRALEPINADGRRLPFRESSADFVYSMLSTLNHFKEYNDILLHLKEVNRVLRKGGIYVADAVVGSPGCIGVCEEWETKYEEARCTVRWIVESIIGRTYIETLELKCNNGTSFASRSELYLPATDEVLYLARKAGFSYVKILKPFTLEEPAPRGRAFIVFIKT